MSGKIAHQVPLGHAPALLRTLAKQIYFIKKEKH